MNCTIKLYNDRYLTIQNNYKIDNLEDYLGNPIQKIENFQLVKIEPTLSIKLNVPQEYSNNVGQSFRYVSISTEENNRTWYFFVISTEWKSQNTVLFNLVMDTVNTFDNIVFSDKTMIIRSHKDRWKANQKLGERLLPEVDKTNEGLNGLPLYKISDIVLGKESDDANLNQPWYLVYRTPDTPTSSSPIEVRLYPQKGIPLIVFSNLTISYTSLEEGKQYFFMQNDGNQKAFLSSSTSTIAIGSETERSSRKYRVIGFSLMKENNNVVASTIEQDEINYSITYLRFATNSSVTLSQVHLERYSSNMVAVQDTSILYSYPVLWQSPDKDNRLYCRPFSSVDKTNDRLIKIIEMPYCPVNYSWDEKGNIATAGTGTDWNDSLEIVVDKDAEFLRSDIAKIIPENDFFDISDYAKNTVRGQFDDPKTLNSSFFMTKIVYDSYSISLPWESFDFSASTEHYLELEMKQSNAIQSNIAFHLKTHNIYFKDTNDYSLFLISTRNNESPIYTNAYLEYLKNGYNYDRKSQTRATALTWATTGLSLVGSAVSFALSGMTGGLSAVAGVGLLTSAVASIGNAINNTAQNEQNIQRNLETSKNQATNVSGVDDLDLLKFYGDNKIHKINYEVSDNMKDKLNDLFYYFGYAVNQYGKPNTKSRMWFNYIQADVVLDNGKNAPYNIYQQDIIERYKRGVTVFHMNIINDKKTWDLAQTKENWEVSLL